MAVTMAIGKASYAQRGATMLSRPISPVRHIIDGKDGNEAAACSDNEADDLCSVVRTRERLSWDVQCFDSLVLLCPSNKFHVLFLFLVPVDIRVADTNYAHTLFVSHSH